MKILSRAQVIEEMGVDFGDNRYDFYIKEVIGNTDVLYHPIVTAGTPRIR